MFMFISLIAAAASIPGLFSGKFAPPWVLFGDALFLIPIAIRHHVPKKVIPPNKALLRENLLSFTAAAFLVSLPVYKAQSHVTHSF